MAIHVLLASSALKTVSVTGLWLIPLLLGAFTYNNYNSYDPEAKVQETDPKKEYDFVIVGGGSAGAVVANRLTEIASWNVLLLETGPDENEITDVPSLAGYLQLTKVDWQYKTEPTNYACLGFKNQRCSWPRGKVLGGSSVLNYMIYVRGNRNDFDQWESFGNPGWSYENVLPYFIKSEDNRNPYLANNKYHGVGGYLTVQEAPWRTPLAAAFVEGGVEIGYENRDINGEIQTGFMLAQGTIRRGSRCSTAKAYLRPVRTRPNLDISLNTMATRVLINPITLKAYGVEYIKNGMKHVVYARKEVIVSAGSINTPQLLMLSGIGPAHHLRHVGIPVLKDLPVGENLHDHVGVGGVTFLVDKPVSIIQNRFQAFPVTMNYVVNERGPMTVLGGLEGIAFVNTKYANKSGLWPDIQFHMAPASFASDNGQTIRKILGLTDELYNTVFKPIENVDAWTIMPLLLHPKTRGYVRLKSSNPFEHPIVNPRYHENQYDVDRLVEGVKIALQVANGKAFKQFGSRLHTIPVPNCKHFIFMSDKYIDCLARTISMTIYHPVGTAKMGPSWDPGAVVDPRLRMHGIESLRVIDASVMPTIVSGNTNAAVVMIAEKGSDMIKQDWLNR
ncbi:unnamed protein product [Pieris macdunnoughi]|uniref:Glucose-methanol-choline oxidoreductase N-terminal domain-containing protein n=1 Tax=Pieris macdunnoughi TaxID=345717 RepID=A0A821U5R0_9NEOP|nr:unnamed protein product [Pieris macdunnoughi]